MTQKLEEARKLYQTANADQRYVLESLFPELKESEDERIRKWIIENIQETLDVDGFFEGQKTMAKNAIAWLEKQGDQKFIDTDNKFIRMRETKPKDISEFLDRLTTVEQEFLWEHIAKIRELDKEEQKPVDKVEPKFKVGNIISNGKVIYRVDGITKNCLGQDCYFLVNIESERDGTRYLILYDSHGKTSHMGETTWLCEQVDRLFNIKED